MWEGFQPRLRNTGVGASPIKLENSGICDEFGAIRANSVGAEAPPTKDFVASQSFVGGLLIPSARALSARHSREGGNPETSESFLGEALDSRLRGNDGLEDSGASA
ncbi:DUF6053 domain-containing protein [Lysobacter capsici]|uniref:DUF6053 domain-containing protein n=1 Tax=Lysobacter capsici TaxID=435897 RepID=UPI003D2F5227